MKAVQKIKFDGTEMSMIRRIRGFTVKERTKMPKSELQGSRRVSLMIMNIRDDTDWVKYGESMH